LFLGRSRLGWIGLALLAAAIGAFARSREAVTIWSSRHHPIIADCLARKYRLAIRSFAHLDR